MTSYQNHCVFGKYHVKPIPATVIQWNCILDEKLPTNVKLPWRRVTAEYYDIQATRDALNVSNKST